MAQLTESVQQNLGDSPVAETVLDRGQNIGRGDGVYISTYGCQMNVNDTERMYSLLEMANFVPVSSPEQASLIVINACSVRERPVHKVYSEVGRYRNLKRKNPNLRIGIGGCVGQQEKGKLIEQQPMIDFVFGTDSIDLLPSIVAKAREGQAGIIETGFRHREPYLVETLNRNPGISTFVNITKGRDNFCTFCVVPYTRGREKSRPLNDLIVDIQNLVKRGVREVTLLGQNVNSYTSSCGTPFSGLLKAISEDTDIQRIRYMTSHPKDFNQELVEISQKYRQKICDYIHLPVQSGNSEVLSRMNRGYSREEYIEKAQMIRQGIPGVTLSTDMIVGSPGETEQQFEDTLSLLDVVPYETLYAFKYSPRPFTKAARFDGQIDEAVKTTRINRFFEKHEAIAFQLAEKYEGQTLNVLVEKHDETSGNLSGRSTQNKLMHFVGSASLIGQTVPVKVVKAFPNNLRGEIIS